MEHAIEIDKQTDRTAVGPRQGGTSPAGSTTQPVLQLQQQARNQAVQSWLRSSGIQAKLAISSPDDPEEREADAVADRILRATAAHPAAAPCSCADGEEKCEACRQKPVSIQRRAVTQARPQHAPESVSRTIAAPGHPLDTRTRAFFESNFARDFSAVRLHTNSHAAESASAINALAYTSGTNIAFGSGQFSPDTAAGQHLLAHELTHVVQQGGANGPPRAIVPLRKSNPSQEFRPASFNGN